MAAPMRPVRALRTRVRGAPRESARESEIWALRNVSFDVRTGEVLGIIGRNGAGKSTLLKVLSRITEPTAGAADVHGRVGSLLEVGTGFHPELSGRENVFLNGAILGMSRRDIRRRFDEIIEFAGVETFVDTPVKRYSSGMYMRLAFSVAAHMETDILVVDEVLAVGDAEFQAKCLGKMEDIAGYGRTVLFVSHNMGAVRSLCREVLVLDRGRIVERTRDVDGATRRYLGTERGGTPAEWRNQGEVPPNPWFSPSRFAIVDDEGNAIHGAIDSRFTPYVQIEGTIERVDPSLTIGYAIYTSDGQLLYWTYQTDTEPSRWPRLQPGKCVLRSRLPSRLLNEGAYRIEMIGGLHYQRWLFTPGVDAPSIELTIEGGLSDSPMWLSKRPGMLAPVLPWSADIPPEDRNASKR